MKLDIQLFAETTITANMSGDSRYTLSLNVVESNVDSVNNTSDVSYTLSLSTTVSYQYGAYNYTGNDTYSININGNVVASGGFTYDFRNYHSLTIKSGTVTGIPHDSDGNKTINISAYVGMTHVSKGSGTATGTLALTKINRSSILTYPANDTRFNIENTFNVRLTKYVAEYYHKLVVKYGNTTIKTINGINDNSSFAFTSSELNTIYGLMSSVKEGIFTFILSTYTNSGMGTLIGSDTKTPIGYIANANPTPATATYQDVNNTTLGLTGNGNIGIKGYSDIQVSITQHAIGNKGATISYYLFPDNQSVNYTSSVSHTLSSYNLTNLYVTAYDTRGNFTTTNIPYTYVDYRQPVINSMIVERKDGVEEETYLGITANLWNGNYSTNRSNEITYFGYRYKETNSSNWSNWIDRTGTFKTAISRQQLDSINLSISDGFKLYTDVANQTGFPQGATYDIQVRISDGYNTTVFNSDYESATLDDGTVLDSYNKTSTGYQYAINGLVDTTKTDGLQVYGTAYIDTNLNVGKDIYNTNIDLFSDTSGSSWKDMMKNKLDYCVSNMKTSKQNMETFINGGWSGVEYGFGLFSKIGTVYQLTWFTNNGYRYVRKIGSTYSYYSSTPDILYNNNTGIQSRYSALIDNLSSYKKLAITFTAYKNSDQANTGGTAHICWLDLSKKDANGYARAGIVVPYSDNHLSSGAIQPNDFKALFEADVNNNRVYCLFAYNNAIQTSSGYVMTKIEGYYN